MIIGFGGVVFAQDVVPNVAVLDHFKCYTAQGAPVNDIAFLRDQFGAHDKTFERDIVRDARMFCNPVQKLHGKTTTDISNKDNHLVWYGIRSVFSEKFTPRWVSVTNQFAPKGQKLLVTRPRFLAVPTQKVSVDGESTGQKTPTDLDHFKCYQVDQNQQTNPQIVQLWDQFNATSNTGDPFRVLQAQFLCNPVAKIHVRGWSDNEPNVKIVAIKHLANHLVCYTITPGKTAAHALVINNQFGNEQTLSTADARLLCVPSAKQLVEGGTDQSAVDTSAE